MRRDEAEKWIGKPVIVKTMEYGKYVGILREITDSKPFRAYVEVVGVVEVSLYRPPFPEGKVINVGAVNVKPYNGEVPGYKESLKVAIDSKARKVMGLLKRSLEELYNTHTATKTLIEVGSRISDVLLFAHYGEYLIYLTEQNGIEKTDAMNELEKLTGLVRRWVEGCRVSLLEGGSNVGRR